MKNSQYLIAIIYISLAGVAAKADDGDTPQPPPTEPYAIITSCQLDEDFYPSKVDLQSQYDFDASHTWQNPEHTDIVITDCRKDVDSDLYPVVFIAVDGVSGLQGRVGSYRVHPGVHTLQVLPGLVKPLSYSVDGAAKHSLKTKGESSLQLFDAKKIEKLEVEAGYRYVIGADYHGGNGWNWTLQLMEKQPIKAE